MLKHYLFLTCRHLWRRKLFSLVSILSLILGLTVFCLTFLHVRHELSYNTGWPDADNIYRMTSKRGGTNADVGRSTFFSAEFIINITNYLEGLVSGYVEISTLSTDIALDDADVPVRLAMVKSGFPDVFELNVIEGSIDRVMDSPGFIALEQRMAETYFGSVDSALGQRVRVSGLSFFSPATGFAESEATEFEVTAVYRLPEPLTSSTSFEAIVPDNDYSARLVSANGARMGTNMNIWMQLNEGVDEEQVNEQLDIYLDEYLVTTRENLDLRGERYSDLFDFKLQALSDIYFGDVPDTPLGDLTRLITFSVVALLVLVAGCSNVISLGFAAAMERRREVGIRKSVGALPSTIAGQHLGESVSLSLVALIPTVALVYALHPSFASMISVNEMPDPGMTEILLMAGISVAVGLVNGLYPAFVLSRVKPVSVLKTQAVPRRSKRISLRSLLVGMQFGFSIVLLVITSGLYLQLWTTRNQPLGFTVENLALLSLDQQQLETNINSAELIANELNDVPGIIEVEPVGRIPFDSASPDTSPYEIVLTVQEDRGVKASMIIMGATLFEFFDIPLLAGRTLGLDVGLPQSTTAGGEEMFLQPVIINRSALKALNMTDPEDAIGKEFFVVFDYGSGADYQAMQTIGVVEDSMLTSLKQRTGPELYRLQNAAGPEVLIEYDPAIKGSVQEILNDASLEVTGSTANISFLEERLFAAFTQERRESLLLMLCAFLALFMSCMGLYGLVSVALKTQVKEIGIRKVLGSTTIGIVATFLTRFSVPVFVANLIAWPVAVYFVLKWIESFPYQMDKVWLVPICLGTTLTVLSISWITVGALSCRAASIRPVKSLRYE